MCVCPLSQLFYYLPPRVSVWVGVLYVCVCSGGSGRGGQQSPLGKQPLPMTWVTLRHTLTHAPTHTLLTSSLLRPHLISRSICFKQKPHPPKTNFACSVGVCLFNFTRGGGAGVIFRFGLRCPLGCLQATVREIHHPYL